MGVIQFIKDLFDCTNQGKKESLTEDE